MFTGSMVALITPMQVDGSIDKKAFSDLIEWHINSKTDGFVIAGTTGEAATLTPIEQQEIIALAVKQVNGRVPVIAGTGTNSTHTTIQQTRAAEQLGVNGCLVVTPYYNRPTQNGLYQHYRMVAENTSLPVILYNVPGRTGCDLLPETAGRLAKISNIIGIKEAVGKMERVSELVNHCGNQFTIYSGDDETALAAMLNGAKGVISVTANIAPSEMHSLCAAALSGNISLAEKINANLLPLHKKLFLESNPIPTKWALHEMGLIPAGIRLPLLPLDAAHHHDLRETLEQVGIIQPIKTLCH